MVDKHITTYMMLASLHKQYPGVPLKASIHRKLNILFPGSSLLKAKDRVSKVSLLYGFTYRSGLSDYLDSDGDGLIVPESLNQRICSV